MTRNDSLVYCSNSSKMSSAIPLLFQISTLSWIPTIPDHISENSYLVEIGIINQDRRVDLIWRIQMSSNAKVSKTIRVVS